MFTRGYLPPTSDLPSNHPVRTSSLRTRAPPGKSIWRKRGERRPGRSTCLGAKCSMVLEYLPTFTQKITEFSFVGKYTSTMEQVGKISGDTRWYLIPSNMACWKISAAIVRWFSQRTQPPFFFMQGFSSHLWWHCGVASSEATTIRFFMISWIFWGGLWTTINPTRQERRIAKVEERRRAKGMMSRGPGKHFGTTSTVIAAFWS